MTARSRLGTGGLLVRHLRSGAGAAVLVAGLVFAAVLAAALAPRALVALGDRELRVTLAAAGPAALDVTGVGTIGVPPGLDHPTIAQVVGGTDASLAALPDGMPEPLRDSLGETRWVVRTPAADAVPPADVRVRLLLSLAVDPHIESVIRYRDGGAPEPWEPDGDDREATPIEIAISSALAERLGVAVGDVLDYETAPVRITGVYEPADADDAFWVHARDLGEPTVEANPGELPTVRASVVVDPRTIAAAVDSFLAGRLTAWVPIDPAALRYADAAELQGQAREVIATRVRLPDAGFLDLRTGLADILDRIVARVSAAAALLALVGSGLLGVLFAVLALGVRAVLQRRMPGVALALARGGSPTQVRLAMLAEGLLVVAPAAGLGVLLAVLLQPADPGPVGWWLPTGVAAVVAALFPALTPTRALRPDRGDLRVAARSSVRWVAEVAVVGLAVVSVVLLARRGLVGTSAAVGIDPLLAAMPALLAAAVGVLVLRLYPAPMLAVQLATRRGDSPTGLVGAARAVRDPALGFPAVLALVVGVAVVVSSAGLATTVRSALERAAVDGVGADLRIQAAALPDDLVADIAATDGVAAAAGVAIEEGVRFVDAIGDDELTLVLADTSALHAVRDDLPELPVDGPAVAIRLSDDWADDVVGTDLELAGAPVSVAGLIPADAIPGVTRHWVLADAGALDRLDLEPPEADQVLVRLERDADVETVAAALDELVTDAQSSPATRTTVTVRSAVAELRAATELPTVGGLEGFLLLAAAAALALTVLAVLLGSVTAAPARGRVLAILRVLGLSRRQVRRVLAWELAPVAVVAALVGTGLGLLLPVLITAVLDLRPFVGGRVQPGAVVDPWWIAAGVAAFLATVVLAGFVAAAVSRRIAPAGVLKMGDA